MIKEFCVVYLIISAIIFVILLVFGGEITEEFKENWKKSKIKCLKTVIKWIFLIPIFTVFFVFEEIFGGKNDGK